MIGKSQQLQLLADHWIEFSFFFSVEGDVGVSTGITFDFGDGLSAALAFVRQQELYPPVEAFSLDPPVLLS